MEADFRALPRGDMFDAVVGRFVLMFQADPTGAIRAVVPHLRPGGIEAFQEIALADQLPRSAPLYARHLAWIRQTFERTGADAWMGLKVHETFLAAGLSEPRLQLDVLTSGESDTGVFHIVAETLASALPLMERLGIASAAEADVETLAARLRAEALVLGRGLTPCVYVGAWARTLDLGK